MPLNDNDYGKETRRGYWTPHQRIAYPPVFIWPPKLMALLQWLPTYFFPWTLLYAGLALLIWHYLTPSVATILADSVSWMVLIVFRNMALTLLVVGSWNFWLYTRRSQATAFKYNRQWPKTNSAVFMFKSQNKENIFWTFASGVPIWSAWEITSLWLYANGNVASLSFAEHPIYCVLLLLLVPMLHECHFFCVHRLLHWAPLYKLAHKLHHNNINPAPWSGLSMHPLEHLLYFSGFALLWLIPAHPIHFLSLGVLAGLSPAIGHTGFERVVVAGKKSFFLPYYAHYLHHRYFDVNFADGVIPLDKWFGSFHDGSAEATAALIARRNKKLRGR